MQIFRNKLTGFIAIAILVTAWAICYDFFYSNPPNLLALNDVRPVFSNNIQQFTDVANEIAHQAVIDSICSEGRGQYTLNGNAVDPQSLPVKYKSFMDTFSQITCVDTESSGDLPTPTPKVYTHPPAVKFVITYQKRPLEGFLYVVDLQQGETISAKYQVNYKLLEQVPQTKWFYFVEK